MAESENEKRAGNKYGKRGVRNHKKHKDNKNKNNKNDSRKKNEQEEDNRKIQITELLRLLIARSQVISQQKFIK